MLTCVKIDMVDNISRILTYQYGWKTFIVRLLQICRLMALIDFEKKSMNGKITRAVELQQKVV